MTKSLGAESFTYKRPHANSFYCNSPVGLWNMHKEEEEEEEMGKKCLTRLLNSEF
jgi:hypothetical protein